MEAQAIKRAHRIGQKHEVFVETLILEDTIEEEMYKNRQAEEKKGEHMVNTKEREMIDNADIQDYIMQFRFLCLYDMDYGTSEISPIESKSKFQGKLKSDIYALSINEMNESEAELPCLQSESKNNGVRRWSIPLFTQNNMTKLSESDAKIRKKSRPKGRENLSKSDNNSKGIYDWSDSNKKTVKLMKKLRQSRKVHFPTQ